MSKLSLTAHFREWLEEHPQWKNDQHRTWAFTRSLVLWVTASVDMLVGAGLAVLSLTTLGTVEELNTLSARLLMEGDTMGRSIYEAVVGLFGMMDFEPSSHPLGPYREAANKWAKGIRLKDHDLLAQARVRIALSVALVIMVLTRIGDLLIGLIAVVLSLPFVVFNRGKWLASFARQNLCMGLLIRDLMLGLIRIINPNAKGLST